MSTPLPTATIAVRSVSGPLQRAWALDWPLTLTGLLMLLVLLGSVLGLSVDPRVITGAPAWLKPAKFALSLSIYCFTFLWLLGQLPRRGRLVRVVAAVTAVMVTLEMVIIGLQAARGQTSHYNMATPFDATLFQMMGLAVVVIWLMALVTAMLLVRQPLGDPALRWALRLAVPIALVGMALAFLMTAPTPAQLAAAAGRAPAIVGAHTVGQPDGGPGLPIVNWSTVAGDLRVAHFVGLHALQVLPALAWWLNRRRLSPSQRVRLVAIGGLVYFGLVLLLTWQALRGQPLIAPDGATLAALGGLIGASSLAVALTLRSAGRLASEAVASARW